MIDFVKRTKSSWKYFIFNQDTSTTGAKKIYILWFLTRFPHKIHHMDIAIRKRSHHVRVSLLVLCVCPTSNTTSNRTNIIVQKPIAVSQLKSYKIALKSQRRQPHKSNQMNPTVERQTHNEIYPEILLLRNKLRPFFHRVGPMSS